MIPLGGLFADRYLLNALAGQGGMGVVYRAEDQLSGKTIALKIMNADPLGEAASATTRDDGGSSERDVGPVDQETGLEPLGTPGSLGMRVSTATRKMLLELFEREANLLAQVIHPNIVRYLAHGTSGGHTYLAMEWLSGVELGRRLTDGGVLTIAECLTLGRRTAEALGAVHARSVVHRDIKPSNLYLQNGDLRHVKILDFGIAQLAHLRSGAGPTDNAMGTPGFMAPEQARGLRDIDARADVYSLGCVLFACLTGAPLFRSKGAAMLASTLYERAPSRLSPGCCRRIPRSATHMEARSLPSCSSWTRSKGAARRPSRRRRRTRPPLG
jgi:eukaryotic-like serine/threonine-protein kinase